MRNLKPILIIVFSLLIGMIAVSISIQLLGNQSKTKTTKVIVATKDLMQGTLLTEDLMSVVEWPATSLLKDPIQEKSLLNSRVTNSQILQGEPIVMNKLAAIGEKGGLSALLRNGSRAVTVKVNEIVGVAGFALPGNYVDVMVNVNDRNNKSISKIILKRILVLALAQDTSTNDTKPKIANAVTLEVTPEQAEIIDLARNVGSLSLVLRSQIDVLDVTTKGSRMEDLYSSSSELFQPSNSSVARPVAIKKTSSAKFAELEKYEVIRGTLKVVE